MHRSRIFEVKIRVVKIEEPLWSSVRRVEVIKTVREIKGHLSFSLEGMWSDLAK